MTLMNFFYKLKVTAINYLINPTVYINLLNRYVQHVNVSLIKKMRGCDAKWLNIKIFNIGI